MNPEEEFEKWWKSNYPQFVNAAFLWVIAKNAWLAAFRLGHHQGMTQAAKMVGTEFELMKATEAAHYRLSDSPFIMESFGISRDKAQFSHDMSEAILTERDKKEIT